MHRLAHGSLREAALSGALDAREIFVFEEPGVRQRVHQMLHQAADIQIAGELYQVRPQIQLRVIAVEKLQAPHQRRRQNQRRIGEVKWIADQEPGTVLKRRGHEVERGAKAGQHGRILFLNAHNAACRCALLFLNAHNAVGRCALLFLNAHNAACRCALLFLNAHNAVGRCALLFSNAHNAVGRCALLFLNAHNAVGRCALLQ